jgi:hypothetical protein
MQAHGLTSRQPLPMADVGARRGCEPLASHRGFVNGLWRVLLKKELLALDT